MKKLSIILIGILLFTGLSFVSLPNKVEACGYAFGSGCNSSYYRPSNYNYRPIYNYPNYNYRNNNSAFNNNYYPSSYNYRSYGSNSAFNNNYYPSYYNYGSYNSNTAFNNYNNYYRGNSYCYNWWRC